MPTIIDISPATRLEGHAALSLTVDDEGIITKAAFLSTTLVRGFEYLVRGRSPEFAIKVVQRICGICPVPHGLASAEAIEQAIGAEVPRRAGILRELLLIADRLHSHALHQYMILPDLGASPEELQAARGRIHDIRMRAQHMADVIGGEAIHPSNICVGGLLRDISPRGAAGIYQSMRECEHIANEQRDAMVSMIEAFAEGHPHKMREYQESLLATDMNYGDRAALDTGAISEITPYRYYGSASAAGTTSTIVPLYNGETVEVGPRARMAIFKGFRGERPIDINVARARELSINVYRALELLDELGKGGGVCSNPVLRTGSGVGVIEAPRGTNLHTVTLGEGGVVASYNIIAPTTWNMPTIERALRGNHQSLAGIIMHSYDPCIDCATHCLEIRDLHGELIERRCSI
jgi:coenzyme F420 hydrogenase subunit alpha